MDAPRRAGCNLGGDGDVVRLLRAPQVFDDTLGKPAVANAHPCGAREVTKKETKQKGEENDV